MTSFYHDAAGYPLGWFEPNEVPEGAIACEPPKKAWDTQIRRDGRWQDRPLDKIPLHIIAPGAPAQDGSANVARMVIAGERPAQSNPRARATIDEGEPAPPPATEGALARDQEERASGELVEFLPPEYSDAHLARRFINLHLSTWRYVSDRSKWHRWTGAVLQPDKKEAVVQAIAEICALAADQFRKAYPKHAASARQLVGTKTILAVERLARTDQRIAILSEQLDTDDMLLNTPAAVFDLRTGKKMPHSIDFLMSKITAAAPGGECPRFQRFLKEVLPNDGDRDYCQRIFGYAASGETFEEVFIFMHGPGGSGKSTLLRIVKEALGDYAIVGTPGMFMESKGERHLTELIDLEGARMVVNFENEQGQHWRESLLKSVVTGETQKARGMRQDPREFPPKCTLFFAGNHRPHFSSPDQSIKRRLRLIPFDAAIANVDEKLLKALRKELPGILGWIVRGAVAWSKGGLSTPKTIIEASDEYIDDEDQLGQWMRAVFICRAAKAEDESEPPFQIDHEAEEPVGDLYESWGAYAKAQGIRVQSQPSFTRALIGKGFRRGRTKKARTLSGGCLTDAERTAQKKRRNEAAKQQQLDLPRRT